MDYLISQIWLCLAIAAILGGIIGWLLRGGCRKKLLDIESSWQDRYALIENENNVLTHQVKDIETLHLEKNTLLSQVKDQEQNRERITVERNGLSSRLSIMEKGVKAAKISLDENQSLLQKKDTLVG